MESDLANKAILNEDVEKSLQNGLYKAFEPMLDALQFVGSKYPHLFKEFENLIEERALDKQFEEPLTNSRNDLLNLEPKSLAALSLQLNNSISGDGIQCTPTDKWKSETAVPCRYACSGCREMVNLGTAAERKHLEVCEFRPIKCIVEGCEEEAPHHSFLIHLHQHFIYPIYGRKLATSIVIRKQDFEEARTWMPKWLSYEDQHFFVLFLRNDVGIWASWVWILSNEVEAEEWTCQITCYKGRRCVKGHYPVHSIRISEHQVLNSPEKNCMLATDDVMKTITRIREKVITDMTINVKIFRRGDADTNETDSVIDVDEDELGVEYVIGGNEEEVEVIDSSIQVDESFLNTGESLSQASFQSKFSAFLQSIYNNLPRLNDSNQNHFESNIEDNGTSDLIDEEIDPINEID